MADFVGSSNVLPPAVSSGGWAEGLDGLRPEAIHLAADGRLSARVVAASFLGATTRLTLDAGDLRLSAALPAGATVPEPGEAVHLAFDLADLHRMEGET